MREIKFRAWDDKDKEMLQDAEAKFFLSQDLHNVVDYITYMQFTGKKDMNGKEIYEGDINQDKGVCEWNEDDCSFIWHYEGVEAQPMGSDGGWGEEQWCEVVGNIYENPELLNQGANHETSVAREVQSELPKADKPNPSYPLSDLP